ncbi:hypothetical protein K2X05_00675 [bacterium]|nr:hypothetical protein [bacterium]
MSKQRHFKIKAIVVNGIKISDVIISDHYEIKHSKYMTDELVLKLVNELDGKKELPIDTKDGFSYFLSMVELNDKPYRLIWLLQDNAIYIGVVNAHRIKSRR